MQRSPPEVEPTWFWPGRRSLFLSPAGLRHQPTPTEASITGQALMWTEDTQSRSQSVSKTQNIHSPPFTCKIKPDILLHIFVLYTKHINTSCFLLFGNGDINCDGLPCQQRHVYRLLHVVYFHRNRLMSTMEEQLFYTITEGQEMITVTQFTSVSADPLDSFPRVWLSSNTNISSAGFKENRFVNVWPSTARLHPCDEASFAQLCRTRHDGQGSVPEVRKVLFSFSCASTRSSTSD